MMAYLGQTRTTLGQLCAALWDSNHGRMWYSLDDDDGDDNIDDDGGDDNNDDDNIDDDNDND